MAPERALGGSRLILLGSSSGHPAERPHLMSGSAWLASAKVGQLTLLDGSSPRGTFEVSRPVTPIPGAGGGLRAFAGPDALYALDSGRDVVTSVDPKTLVGCGGLLSLAAQVTPQASLFLALSITDPDNFNNPYAHFQTDIPVA